MADLRYLGPTPSVDTAIAVVSLLKTHSWTYAITEDDVNCATGNGKIAFCVPGWMAGMDITDLDVGVHASGTTGTMDIQARRRRGVTDVDIFSTKVTLGSGETSIADGVVNTSNDDLNQGDMIYIDIDTIHTTPAKGLTATLTAVGLVV